MVKKCIICGKEAVFTVKGSSEYYCDECAHESFSDITLLQRVEDEARALKEALFSDYEAVDESHPKERDSEKKP